VALVCVLACAVLFGWLLNNTVHRIVLDNSEAQTATFVRHLFSTEFHESLFLNNEPIHDVDLGRRLLESLALEDVFRIKIFGRDGTIIWSDETELLGVRFPDNMFVVRALEGEITSVIEAPKRTEHVFERGMFDKIMETYVPITYGGEVIGVVEVYRHPTDFFRQTKLASVLLWCASLGGGTLLYLAMVGVVRRINDAQHRLGRDLRRSADELAAEKSKLERIVNAMGAGLVLVGPDGRVQWTNETAESWFGGDAQLVGASVLDRFCRDRPLCRGCPLDSVKRSSGPVAPSSGVPVICEHEFPSVEGRDRVYQFITTPERSIDPEGISGNFLQLILDVTEAKAVEAQLRQGDKMSLVGQLTAGIAHQINNPAGILLTTITHHLGRVKEDDGDCLKRDLEMMERQCRRIDHSIRSLLSFSRMPEGNRVPVDLATVLKEGIELTEPRMKRNSVAVETSLDERPCVTMGDPNDVLQVVLNVLNNAIDAMPEGGDLKIALKRTPPRDGLGLCITVSDTGEGLPPGNAARVFEPFFTTKETGRGTGLGLAVSTRIVEALGGKIGAANGETGGAVFEIRFPTNEAQRGS
jgi:signal transduction histidine kinase